MESYENNTIVSVLHLKKNQNLFWKPVFDASGYIKAGYYYYFFYLKSIFIQMEFLLTQFVSQFET